MEAKNDSKEASDKSTDDEKVISGNLTSVDESNLPNDPDAHLGASERAAIVSTKMDDKDEVSNIFQDRKLVWKLDIYLIPWVRDSLLPSAADENY